MRAFAFLVALAGLSVLAVQQPGHATGTDYYVSSTAGNDDNNGLTPLTPWASIAKVNSVLVGPGCTPCAQPGDTLNLHIGSYWHGTTLALTRSGLPMAPITVKIFGGSGAVPIISGAHPCISITGDYNVVRGVRTIDCYGPNWGPEQTIQCLDDLDSDLDGKVNDGCPAIGPGELVCSDALDDDADGGFVNDGCPSSGYQPAGVRIDGDGKGGAEARAVVVDHHRNAELIQALSGHGHADDARRVLQVEVDRLRSNKLSRDNKIALVLAAFVINDDDTAAETEIGYRVVHTVEVVL